MLSLCKQIVTHFHGMSSAKWHWYIHINCQPRLLVFKAFLFNVSAHYLQRKELKRSLHNVCGGGNHSVQDVSPSSDPLLPRRAVLLPQKAPSPFFLIIHVQLILLFPCPALTFSAPAATIQGMSPPEQDVPPASIPLDTPVLFP